MKKTISKLWIVLMLITITSCSKQEKKSHQSEHEQTSTKVSGKQHPITTHVKMAYIPGGEYKPFYGTDTSLVTVAPFLIDERAVTNQEFLEFLKENPQWRKSQVKRIYADTSYLSKWPSDLELPANALPDAPVCQVSWFAAKAYAQSVGKRLPTLDEWEFVAMADEVSPNARKKPQYSAAIISLYMEKERQYKSVMKSKPNYWGVYNLFDLIWEWTDDFNSILTTSDSRNSQYEDKNLFCAAGATSSTDVLNYAAYMRFALRTTLKANYTIANLGFRCAKDTTISKAN